MLFRSVVKTANQAMSGIISGTAAESGTLVMRVIPPAGFTSNITDKTLTVTKGDVINIPVTITAPATAQLGMQKVLLQYRNANQSEMLAVAKLFVIKGN